ncbi:type II toxin-antitoxin system HicB family antitoxin [Candidatus Woesearchaeota archaeon]|nr:type II toxin-antitoxin system HicB family antitoxin [Candidatus Woesearchaeota archaeon]
MKLTIVLEPQEEGGYTVYVPSLPGCISEGDTKKEAIQNIKEAIDLYLEADTNDLVESAHSTSVFTSGLMEGAGLKKIGPSEARMPSVY